MYIYIETKKLCVKRQYTVAAVVENCGSSLLKLMILTKYIYDGDVCAEGWWCWGGCGGVSVSTTTTLLCHKYVMSYTLYRF